MLKLILRKNFCVSQYEATTILFDASHQDAFFMYWSRQLKISSALNRKKKRKTTKFCGSDQSSMYVLSETQKTKQTRK